MMWLALAAAWAAGPDEAALTSRLLTDRPAPTASPAPKRGGALEPGAMTALAIAGVAAGITWVFRKNVQLGAAPQALRIAGRVGIGGSGALVLVDVDDGAGNMRRLLVGASSGPPALLADLGDVEVRPVVAPTPAPTPRPSPAPSLPRADKAGAMTLIDEVLRRRAVEESS